MLRFNYGEYLLIFMTEELSGVAEIGLLSLRLSDSRSASLGDFLLAPVCPVEKVILWEGFLYLTLGSEPDEGVTKDHIFARTGNQTQDSGSKTQCATH